MLKFEDSQAVGGDFRVEVIKGGKVVEVVEDHNMVVYNGRVRLAELLSGNSSAGVTQIGVGSGTTAEASTDEELQGQQLFPLTAMTVNGRNAKFDFEIGETQANGLAITEFGLFCSDGKMFSHRVRRRSDNGQAAVIEKQDDIIIKGYWVIHF